MIPHLIYGLCVVTCLGCSLLLWRAFRMSRLRLLCWSALCFLILAIGNLLLFVDLVLYTDVNMIIVRTSVTLLGTLVLICGLIFKSR